MSASGIHSYIPKWACTPSASSGRRGHARFRASLTPRLIQLVLVFTLLVAEPLGARSWNAGGHVTPEQWARHMLLNGLGFVDHHASDSVREVNRDVPAPDIRSIVAFANAPISTSGLVPSGLAALPPGTSLVPFLLVALTVMAVMRHLRRRSARRPPLPPPRVSVHSNGLAGSRAQCPLRP